MTPILSRRAVLGGLALLPVAAAGAQPASLPAFRRGISMANAFGWADVRTFGGYADPPFGPGRFSPLAEQLRTIHDVGFDFVRLVVDPGPFLSAAGVQRDALDRLLATSVTTILDLGLGVIVDLHPSRMNSAYAPDQLTAGVGTAEFQAVTAFLTHTAASLDRLAASRHDAPRLALELMNEPEITPEAWAPMLAAAYRAARHGAARLPLVVGGGTMNAPEALEAIDASVFAGDDRVIYTFHDYQPWQFTHQGLPGNPANVFADVPYPAPPTADAMIAASDQRIGELSYGFFGGATTRLQAHRALTQYAGSGYDRAAMDRAFMQVDAWRKSRGLPADAILLGEFGVHLTPYMRSAVGAAARLHWLRDMRELAEAHGFGWACWDYVETGGFALARNERGPGFEPGMMRALGLGGDR